MAEQILNVAKPRAVGNKVRRTGVTPHVGCYGSIVQTSR